MPSGSFDVEGISEEGSAELSLLLMSDSEIFEITQHAVARKGSVSMGESFSWPGFSGILALALAILQPESVRLENVNVSMSELSSAAIVGGGGNGQGADPTSRGNLE